MNSEQEETDQPLLFNVDFQGKIATGQDRETVIQRFAELFKLPPAKAQVLFDGKRRTIKKNLSREQASQFRQRLKQIGVRVALVKVESQASRGSRFTLSPPGVVLSPEMYRPPTHIDTSGLSISEDTGPLVEKPAMTPPKLDLSAFQVEEEYAILEPKQPVAAPDLDVSGLDLDEPGVVIVEAESPVPPEFSLDGLSLDEKGAVIVTPESPPAPEIPTDHLKLAD